MLAANLRMARHVFLAQQRMDGDLRIQVYTSIQVVAKGFDFFLIHLPTTYLACVPLAMAHVYAKQQQQQHQPTKSGATTLALRRGHVYDLLFHTPANITICIIGTCSS